METTVVICHIPKEERFFRGLMQKYSTMVGSGKALNLPPHITLVGRFKTDRYDAMVKALEQAAVSISPFEIKSSKIGGFMDVQMLKIGFLPSEKMQSAHVRLIDAMVGYRTAWVRPSFLRLQVTGAQAEYLQKYGSPYVREFYSPHITLAGPDVDPVAFSKIIFKFPMAFEKTLLIDDLHVLIKIDDEWKVDKHIMFGRSKYGI